MVVGFFLKTERFTGDEKCKLDFVLVFSRTKPK